MDNKLNKSKPTVRRYPTIYEKIVPVAIGILVLLLLILLVITFGVAFGVWAIPAQL